MAYPLTIYPAGQQCRQDEQLPGRSGIAVAGGAGIPARVVQLITLVWKWEAMNHLQVNNGTVVGTGCYVIY